MGFEDGVTHTTLGIGRRSHRARSWALVGSALFHAGVLVALFGSASGDVIAGAEGGGSLGPVFQVALVAPPPRAAAGAPAPSDAGLRPLLARLEAHSEARPVVQTPANSPALSQMFERLRDRTPSPPAPKVSPPLEAESDRKEAAPSAPQTMAKEVSSKAATGRAAASESRLGEALGGSSGALAGRIEPCLRGRASGPIPVLLEVSLDSRGGLSVPPKILRAPGADPTEARLRAEAQALSSLAACLPRGDLRLGGKTYQLEFGGGR